MGKLDIYWGNRLEDMAETLFDSLYGDGVTFDPMVPRCIVTNSPVMRAWLKHYFVFEWKGRKGRVLANCDFELLYPFVNDWMDRLLTDPQNKKSGKRSARNHPYSITNMQWRIYRLFVDGELDGDIFQDVKLYIGDNPSPRRQFQLAGKLADMFDEYQVYRHHLILAWQADNSAGDWQGELWRLLMKDNNNSYAALFSRMEKFPADMIEKSFNGKYERISIFGTTSMASPYLYFLENILSKVVDVDLFVLNPGRGFWLDKVGEKIYKRQEERLFLESPELIDDPMALPEKGHELLCSLGISLQEYLFSLPYESGKGAKELFFPSNSETLLESLQGEILNTEYSSDVVNNELLYYAKDDSIQIHICHSARREVEVLHDHLLKWLSEKSESGKTLQPYQIQVLVTDMAAYVPHIDAVFGDSVKPSTKDVPYAIESRRLSVESETLSAFMTVCNIVTSRFQLSSIMDLIANDAVMKSFNLNPEDLSVIEQIVSSGNIRWGLDATQREKKSGIKMSPYMTWEYGLDRLLMGYATGEAVWYEELYSTDYAEGATAEILGKLTRFIVKLKFYVNSISKQSERTFSDWHKMFTEILDSFFESNESSYREVKRIRQAVNDFKELADNTGMTTKKIPFDVIVAHIEKDLSSTTTGDSLLANAVVFCQLNPMNSHPAEITCVLGLNDGVFPRKDNRPTFDLMAKSRLRGDRSLRNDDRSAFLESLINARKKFYLSYTGRTDKSNEVIPPSIVLQELKDYLKSRCKVEEVELLNGSKGLPFETLHHLNAVHPDYFDVDARKELFSYSLADCIAAKQLILSNSDKPGSQNSIAIAEKSKTSNELELDDFTSFFKNPAKYFYKNILDVRLDKRKSLLPDDDEPMEVDTLENYKLKTDFMDILVDGAIEKEVLHDLTRISKVEGIVPLGDVGNEKIQETIDKITDWLEKSVEFDGKKCGTVKDILKLVNGEATPADVIIISSDKIRTLIRGSYRAVEVTCSPSKKSDEGEGNSILNLQVFARPTKINTKDRIKAWLSHLVACSVSDKSVHTIMLGTGNSKKKAACECFLPLNTKEAHKFLENLLDIYYKGQLAPLPFAAETSETYCIELRNNESYPNPDEGEIKMAVDAAKKKWIAPYKRCESMDESLFHAFGEDGPMIFDGDMNSDFDKFSRDFFDSLLDAKSGSKNKRKGSK